MSEKQLTLQQQMLHKFLSIVDKNGRINKDLPKYSHLSQCWHHTRAAASHGYGQITINRQAWLTHRLSYHVHNGFPDLKSDQIVLHACDNKMCVNPDHLTLGTHKENAIECQERIKGGPAPPPQNNFNRCLHCKTEHHQKCEGGFPCTYCIKMGYTDCAPVERKPQKRDFKPGQHAGENNVKAKLTEANVRDLLTRKQVRGDVVAWANEFGVGRGAIGDILKGKTWSNIYKELNPTL